MSFRPAIAAIPYASTQSNATGLLAPIMRAAGHILYIVGCLAAYEANPDTYVLTDEEVHTELGDARAHLAGTAAVAETAPISTAARTIVSAFCDAVTAAYNEYPDWPQDERGRNLRDLADRAAALATFFDTELTGVRGSDPGRSL